MKVIKVRALPEYKICVEFEDGVNGIIDLQKLVQQGIFKELTDEFLFSKVYTTGYSVAWSDELEIDALTIYAELLNKRPEELFQPVYTNAPN